MTVNIKKLDKAIQLVKEGINKGYFPGAAVAVGGRKNLYFIEHFGNRSLYPENHSLERDTLFDMASLTKVMATTPLLIRFLEDGKISLYDKISEYVEVTEEKKEISILDLLTHTAGFKSFVLFEKVCTSYKDAIKYITNEPLECEVGSKVMYSDFSFILLGYILEQIGGDTLDNLCRKYVFQPLSLENTTFNPISKNVVATEMDKVTGKMLLGSVHDENSRFFGGVSGHAGLFSTIEDTAKYAKMLVNSGKIDGQSFISKNGFNSMVRNYTSSLNEDRALGWLLKADKMSSGGELISPSAFGHTGFTGTSIWVDIENDIYAILLTNRVHPTRNNTHILRFRRLFHNAVISAVE
ncbi:serine hydrolase domain-containing protein [Clostridium sp.]|uniref:serine hydrolase domain-containing protein n=1 Tax=Clostridium sp. TaxID=1506 RepID=UPI003D6D4CCE